jgi:hypothetical protein
VGPRKLSTSCLTSGMGSGCSACPCSTADRGGRHVLGARRGPSARWIRAGNTQCLAAIINPAAPGRGEKLRRCSLLGAGRRGDRGDSEGRGPGGSPLRMDSDLRLSVAAESLALPAAGRATAAAALDPHDYADTSAQQENGQNETAGKRWPAFRELVRPTGGFGHHRIRDDDDGRSQPAVLEPHRLAP